MRSRRAVLALLAALFTPQLALAGDAVQEALAKIPESAAAFLCVPNMKQMDTDLQEAITTLGLEQMVPPGMLSSVALMQQQLGASEGLQENGALTLVLVPVPKEAPADPAAGSEFPFEPAFILPASNAQALLGSMGAQAGEGSIWSMELHGEPFYGRAQEKFVVLSNKKAAVDAAVKVDKGIRSKLGPQDLDVFSGRDLVAWLDCEKVFTALRPQIEQLTAMMSAMQAASNPQAMASAQASKEQIDMVVDGARSMALGLGLDAKGLGLRFFITGREGSELAKQMKLVETGSGSMLQGLPADKFMVALGARMNPVATKESMKYLTPMLTDLAASPDQEKNKEHIDEIKSLIEQWGVLMTRMSAAISPLPEGADGLVGAALVVDCSDSAKSMELSKQLFETVKKLDPGTDVEAKQVLDALSYKTDAEEVAGVKMHHLLLDVSKFEDADEEWLEDLDKVIGKDGLLLRLGAVNDKRWIVSFGGGDSYAGRLVKQARDKEAPLANDPGIKRLSEQLPEKKSGEFYLSLDQIIHFVRRVQKTLDEEQLPLEVPVIDAPLAVVQTGGADWQRVDLLLPTELMSACKGIVMTLMGGPQPGQQQTETAPADSASGV